MDKKDIYKRKGGNIFRHNKIFNAKINTQELNENYELSVPEINELSETGLLTIFKIHPRSNKEMPSFSGRWDEKQNMLDMDILNVTDKISTLFKAGKDGYFGHHPIRISESPRLFQVIIKIPEHDIFNGEVTFNINMGHAPGALGPFT